MAEEASKSYNIHIASFNGEAEKVKWFCDQLKELKSLNQWSDEVALLFLKSKLCGSAQEWFSLSPSCKNIKTFDEACKKLIDFFSERDTPTTNLLALQNIHLLPGETVRNLAFRIETMTSKTYPLVSDPAVLNQIMSVQLLNALPMSIQEKLMLDDDSDFKKLVEKAHKIALRSQNLKLLEANTITASTSTLVANDQQNMLALQSKIEQLTIKLNENQTKCQFCGSNHLTVNCQAFKNSIMEQLVQSRSSLPQLVVKSL